MPGVRQATVETPHLEWLAARGTLFRNAYCASPLCTPARAALLSGRYPHDTGMVANNQPRPITEEMRLGRDVQLLADYLRPLGYACAYTGKWHIGTGGDRRGFGDFTTRSADFDVDGPEQNEMLLFGKKIGAAIHANYVRNFDPADYDRHTQVGSSLLPLAFHPATRDAYAAAHFIRLMAQEVRPFVLGYSCHEPHQPFVSPRPFSRMYRPEGVSLPATLVDEAAMALARSRGERRLKPAWLWSADELRSMWAAYYGAVSYVDHLVGIILEALIDTDQLENTLLIYTSDHGEMLGSHGLVLKGEVMYEELINVPLLIAPPGDRTAGHQTARLVSHVDLVPTILSWCSASIPDVLQGVNIRPLVEGNDVPVREGVAVEYHSTDWGECPIPLRCWRTEEWKYVESADPSTGSAQAVELYHLTDDPQERHNLVGAPDARAIREQLQEQLRAFLARSGDRWPEVILPSRFLPPYGVRWPEQPVQGHTQ